MEILLVCPVGIYMNLNSSKLALKIIFLGIPIKIPTERKAKAKTKKVKKRKNFIKNTKPKDDTKTEKKNKKLDIIGILELVGEILPDVGKFLGRLGKGIIISKLEIFLLLYDEDYAKLGKTVGYANGLLFSVQHILARAFTLKNYKSLAAGSFGIEQKNTVVELKIWLSPVVPLVALIRLGVSAITKYIKHSTKNKKNKIAKP